MALIFLIVRHFCPSIKRVRIINQKTTIKRFTVLKSGGDARRIDQAEGSDSEAHAMIA
jgi:hypothetical protein